jgi:large subunit ribosomal protein L18
MAIKIREKNLSKEKKLRRERRHNAYLRNHRMRGKPQKPRIVVFRSHKHIYAQLVVDLPIGPCKVITSASSLSPDVRKWIEEEQVKGKVNIARFVGRAIAKRALERGIEQVVFDRSGYRYHGRIKALAEGARESGLRF